MSKRGFVVALLALAGGGLLGLTAHVVGGTWTMSDSFAAPFTDMRACGSQSNPIVCTRPIVKKLLETKNASEIMDALATRFGPAQCHYIGHVVGQQAYVKNQSIELSLSQCSQACDSACVHGVIGEAFAEELGLGDPDADDTVDLMHLSVDEIRTIGRQLCKSPEACHGVGHTVFQITKDLPKAMTLCKGIAPGGSSACYNGAAMEYADILAGRNMRAVPDIQLPDIKSITSVCTDLPTIVEQRSCFRYYPRMVLETFKADGYSEEQAYDQLRTICSSYSSSPVQTACFSGVGSYNTYFILTDPSKAVEACKSIPGERNQAACYFGEIAVAVEERQTKLIPYCGMLPSQPLQSLCYQSVFFYLNKLGTSMDAAAAQCGSENTLCNEGRKNYELMPWDEIFKNFKA